jgi:hypothetical protein
MPRKRAFFSRPDSLDPIVASQGALSPHHGFSIHLLALGHTQVDFASQNLKLRSLCSILSAWGLLGQYPNRRAGLRSAHYDNFAASGTGAACKFDTAGGVRLVADNGARRYC